MSIICAAYNMNTGKCKGLDVRECESGKCRFCATPEELAASKERALRRIATLPYEQQEYIAAKYYDGDHPWK